jgi:hypothetical protein
MRKRINSPKFHIQPEENDKKNDIKPLTYPASEDIYVKSKEEEINPEIISGNNFLNNDPQARKEKSSSDISENELDIPGAELDDQQEIIGSEDEENNYYSIGGDRHEDLEESN